ncbi:MAG: hypothetical protein QGF09_05335 [Rhodospirillales bacterium]|nr:hypothetical protein [Rhodospirillales bacterium]
MLQADGKLNRAIAWWGFCLGVAAGLVMGLWSFDGPMAVPVWIGGYDRTPRRLLRLGYIAFFGIGFLNLGLAGNCPVSICRSGQKSWPRLR